MTKVLMISTDAKILEEGTPVRARMREYGALFEELHIIVCALKNEKKFSGERIDVADNVHAYPTNSSSKLLYARDARKLGERLLQSNLQPLRSGKDQPAEVVIVTQDPFETGLVGLRLSQAFNLPLQVQIHTDFMSPYFKHGLLNYVRLRISSKVLAHASAIRAVSERIRQSLSPELQAKTSILPIFADLSAFRAAGNAGMAAADLRAKYSQFKKIVLIASRIMPEKDFGTALAAFAEVARAVPQAGLVIVGHGRRIGQVRKMIASLGIEDKVEIEGWADQATLAAYMKSCDVFLSTSLYEGYGLSMLEAHAAGAALVATDAGIAPLLAAPAALVPPKSPQKLAKALKMALEGAIRNRDYKYPYPDKKAYLEAYKADIERVLSKGTV